MKHFEVAFSCIEKDADQTKKPWMEYLQIDANSELEAVEKARDQGGYDDEHYFFKATFQYVKEI